MIVVCNCGQKSRVRDFTIIDKLRCGSCKQPLRDTIERHAARNANIVLEIAAVLLVKPEAMWTKEEETIARILQAHHSA